VENIERRSTERRPVGENRARVMWDGGAGPWETLARLVDISRGGARYVSGSPIPMGRDVCLRLETPGKTGWVLARVVRSEGGTGGGLAFERFHPHDLFAGVL
jgi:PilZ domain